MSTTESLVRYYAEAHPESAAHALENEQPEDAAEVIDRLPHSISGPVLENLPPVATAQILEALGPDKSSTLLEGIDAHHAAAVLEHVNHDLRERLLATLPDKRKDLLERLASYAPDTAGAMMDLQVASLPADLTAERAISRLRKAPRQALYYLYVTNRRQKLIGVLGMRNLLLAEPSTPIKEIMHPDITAIPATMVREDVAALMRDKKFLALPVTDESDRLIGVVKYGQVLEAVEQKAFEDLQTMVGAGSEERALSPFPMVVKSRLPWLGINLLTAFAAAAVVGIFESTIERVTALAVLLPVVAGQGGNTGAQALAVIMRGLALREVEAGMARQVLLKETIAGTINGLVIGVLAGAAAYAWDGRWALGVVIFLAMIVNMAAAALTGAAVPMVLQAMGRDPAQASSIILTTVTDIVGFAAFLGLAVAFMPLLAPLP